MSNFEGMCEVPPQVATRFFKKLEEIAKLLNINEDPGNLLSVLKKIED